jgi:hypothetical protein
MKYFTFLAVSALMFTWIACGHGRPVDETGITQPVAAPASTTQPQTIPVNLNSQPTPATITPSSSTVAGLNPEHGQPGHRCDIAVGAPLNSKPAQPATTPSATPFTISSDKPSPPAATTAVAPGMNPAHGQPGHRCDIAVGAPLNSKPAQPATTPSATPFTISSDKPSSPAATTAVAPGMNPAHGQPGHRCDIAVGAPLNSKPAQQPASNGTTPINISSDQAAKTATTAVAPGMNPAHGQPGHRCDIAVGAALNSKPVMVEGIPSTNTNTNTQSIPAIVPIKPTQDTKKGNR